MSEKTYQFEPTCFVGNSLWQQWRRLFGQVISLVMVLISGDVQKATAATWAVKQECETLHRILSGQGADVELGKNMAICDSLDKGDYA